MDCERVRIPKLCQGGFHRDEVGGATKISAQREDCSFPSKATTECFITLFFFFLMGTDLIDFV